MAEVKSDYFLDCRRLGCPQPVLKLKGAMEKLDIGQIVEMLATDPASTIDVPAWTKKSGHQLMEVKKEKSFFRYRVKKVRG